MSLAWRDLIDEQNDLPEDDQTLKEAAYKLITSQVLYEQEPMQRTAYRTVRRNQAAYRELMDLFGLELLCDDSNRYCAVVPRDVRSMPLPLDDTLLILILRKEYHDRASRGEVDGGGRAIVTIQDLQAAYLQATNRKLPDQAGELREVINRLRRYGLAKALDNDPGASQPFEVAVLPAIAELVNEAVAARISSQFGLDAEDVESHGEVDDEAP